jgi:hypothetical protein
MHVRRKEVQAPTATTIDTAALTPITWDAYLGGTYELRVFYDDTGNVQNSDLYAEYSPDGTTWYEEQAYSIAVTAGELWTTYVLGGFWARISAQKAVAAEDVDIGIYDENQQSLLYREVTLLKEDTVNVAAAPGTIMYAGGVECKEVCDIVVYIDDNGNANNLTISIWMAPEYPGGTPTWHVAQAATNAHTAKDRRAAFVVRNTMGQMIKVLGVKAVGAEDVIITVKGRLPYFRQQKL